jgi:hypothetical protein
MLIQLRIRLPKDVRALLRAKRKDLKARRDELAKSNAEARDVGREFVRFYVDMCTRILVNATASPACGCAKPASS